MKIPLSYLMLAQIFFWPLLLLSQKQELNHTDYTSAELQVQRILNQLSGDEKIHPTKKTIEKFLLAFRYESEIPVYSRARLALLTEFGFMLNNLKAYRMSILFSKQELELRKKMETGSSLPMCHATGRIGINFLSLGEHDSAKFYFNQQLKFSLELKKDKNAVASSLNNIGMAQFASGAYDSAHFYYQQALKHMTLSGKSDSAFYVSIMDNQADLYLEQGKADKALAMQQKGLAITQLIGRTDLAIKRQIEIAEICLQQGEGKKAEKYLQSVHPGQLPGMEYRRRYLQAKVKLCHEKGQWQEATAITRQLLLLNDSLEINHLLMLDNIIESLYSLKHTEYHHLVKLNERISEKQEQLHVLNREKGNFRFLSLVLSGTIALLILGYLVLWYRKKEKKKSELLKDQILKEKALTHELEDSIREKARYQEELENKERTLAELAAVSSVQRTMHQEAFEKLSFASSLNDEDKLLFISDLQKYYRNKLQLNHKLSVAQDQISSLNKAFYKKLDEKFPDLNSADKEFCGFIMSNLNTKEIATLLNVTPKAVKMRRYRLRKKMNLENHADIREYLISLCQV